MSPSEGIVHSSQFSALFLQFFHNCMFLRVERLPDGFRVAVDGVGQIVNESYPTADCGFCPSLWKIT